MNKLKFISFSRGYECVSCNSTNTTMSMDGEIMTIYCYDCGFRYEG